MKQKINNEPINQELLEILTKYYDGSFARLVQEYIRTSGITEEEREALVEAVKNYQSSKIERLWKNLNRGLMGYTYAYELTVCMVGFME